MRFGLQTVVPADGLAGFPRRRPRGRGRRLGLGLDVGPPARDLRAVGAADLRGLDGPRRARAAVTSRVRLGLMVGANTFRNPGITAKLATTLDHISGGRAVLGHRRRLVRARARRVRHPVRRDPGLAPRPARRVGDADAPPPRRGAVQPRRPRSTRSTTRCASRVRSSRTSRSSSAAPAAEDAADRRDARRRLEHLGHGRGSSARRSTPSRSTPPTSGATSRRSR